MPVINQRDYIRLSLLHGQLGRPLPLLCLLSQRLTQSLS